MLLYLMFTVIDFFVVALVVLALGLIKLEVPGP